MAKYLQNKALDLGVSLAGAGAGFMDTLPTVPITNTVEIGPLLYALGALLIKKVTTIAWNWIKLKYGQRLGNKDK